MRKKWLGLATLLVGSGAADAQQFPPMPSAGYPAGYAPMPAAASYGPPGAFPAAPSAFGYGPAAPFIPTSGLPAQAFVPPNPTRQPMAPLQQPPAAPLPPSPTVPITEVDPNSLPGAPFATRIHNDAFWFKADYLTAWITNGPLAAALITAGSPTDPHPGALNAVDKGTNILFGGKGLDFHNLNGARAEAGYFVDGENRHSIDAGVMYLAPTHIRFDATSNANGSPLFARPIINAATGAERSFLTSTPDSLAGSTMVDAKSELWGVELNGRKHGYWGQSLHVETLLGFRTLTLRESIRVRDNLRDIAGDYLTYNGVPLNAGDRLFEQDFFQMSNHFYGSQLGAGVTIERDWFSIGVLSKFGLGVTDQKSVIDGLAALTSPGLGNSVSTGGILAQTTNIGTRHHYVFGFVPEIGANVCINITNNIRFNTGYSFLYWNSVNRPGELIERTVNVGLPPGSPAFGAAGPARPAYVPNESTFIIHTLNIGLEVRF